MLNKNFFTVLLPLFFVLILSGCSITGRPDGGIYKSGDGGNSFEQKVYISEEESIANSNILAIESDPNRPGTVYIGTESSGLLRSTDGADSWARDEKNFYNVRDIEVVPNNSDKIYIAAQLGGRGKVFKTENAGEEWVEIYTEKIEGSAVTTIAVDYNNSDVVYIGNTKGGIFKSEDGGKTWKSLLWAESGIKKITLDKADSSTLYVATTSKGALVSKNRGQDFTEIVENGEVYNIFPHPDRGGVVYLSNKEGLQRSVDYGENWETINTLVKPKELVSYGLGVNPQRGDEIFYASGKALYKSTNEGETWQTVQFNISRTIRVIEIDAHDSNIIYIGTGESVSSFKLFPG